MMAAVRMTKMPPIAANTIASSFLGSSLVVDDLRFLNRAVHPLTIGCLGIVTLTMFRYLGT